MSTPEGFQKNPYFVPHTGMSMYDDMLDDTPMGESYGTRDYYKFEKGLEYEIRYMTPDQYIQKIADSVFRTTYEKAAMCNREAVEKYANMMEEGTLFNMPSINLSNYKGQEGRHRMLAVKLISERQGKEQPRLPVMVVTKAYPTKRENIDYTIRKWGKDHLAWGYRYLSGEDLTEEELKRFGSNVSV